jgi:hypothetical protein
MIPLHRGAAALVVVRVRRPAADVEGVAAESARAVLACAARNDALVAHWYLLETGSVRTSTRATLSLLLLLVPATV